MRRRRGLLGFPPRGSPYFFSQQQVNKLLGSRRYFRLPRRAGFKYLAVHTRESLKRSGLDIPEGESRERELTNGNTSM